VPGKKQGETKKSQVKIDSTELTETQLAVDQTFRALGEFNRRAMLEIIYQQPGISQQALTEYFSISRFAVMKHLNILEAAELIRKESEGKHKLHYFAQRPLAQYVLPWIQQFKED